MADRMAFIAEAEGFSAPREGFEMIARTATGSLRDAINLLEQIRDTYGPELSLETIREGLGLIADERAVRLAFQAIKGDFTGGLTTIGSVADDGLDLKQFQKEVVLRLRELLLVQSGAASEGTWTAEQIAESKAGLEGVAKTDLVRALRAFGQADLRADPLSPLPLELALAEAALPPQAPAAASAAAAAGAAAPTPMPRPAVQRPTAGERRAPPPVPPPPAPRPPARQQTAPVADRTPTPIRGDLKDASAEEIARMLGSNAPVIPPASDEPTPAATPNGAPANGSPAPVETAGNDGLSSIVPEIYAAMRQEDVRVAAFMNGSCHAVSLDGGVLTLGFYADFHKGKVTENLKSFEDVAGRVLGSAISIRCIMTARPAKPLSKSPLVQHAVETHGATIVSGDQES
jgi:DNA polymerase-3 subunit gamma/tau